MDFLSFNIATTTRAVQFHEHPLRDGESRDAPRRRWPRASGFSGDDAQEESAMSREGSDVSVAGVDATLADSLARIELPPRPAILDQVMAEMQSEEPDYRRLATMIMSDVGLSAWLVKTANAPIFGYRTKARTVRDALTMLGLIMVLRTVAGYAVRQALPESPALTGFWDTSARVAHLSGWLAREIGIKDGVRPQDAYTYGLFRDCGILVLLRANASYEDILAEAMAEPLRPFTEVESEHLALNHAIVGSAMAQSWYLPEAHCAAILHHHDLASLADSSADLSPAARRLVALAQLAEFLQGKDSPPTINEWHKMGESVLSALQLTPDQIEPLHVAAQAVLQQLE
ncbi:HDOD domain-containing protein [Aromatoleum diolicum]|uniref:HDOD domain-containing protein n=1 Tax=Aromatoleum diolicum TaxID=75796 RepID=A0ABX1QH84_9RHOO|nr:HDOD domain-containing protein [Aromatoleum diolicum]NMG76727.1 HDOD domain-containing protein [Aromatoleum diolicum]